MNNLSPEQIQLLQKALQQLAEKNANNQVNPQQIPIDLTRLIEQGPQIISNLISLPVAGAGNALTGLLNGLLGIVTGLLGSASGVTNGLAPNLINIIKKEIPVPKQESKENK